MKILTTTLCLTIAVLLGIAGAWGMEFKILSPVGSPGAEIKFESHYEDG